MIFCPACNKPCTPNHGMINCRTWTYSGISFYHNFYYVDDSEFSMFFQDLEIHAVNGNYVMVDMSNVNRLDPNHKSQIIRTPLPEISYCQVMEVINKYNRLVTFL